MQGIFTGLASIGQSLIDRETSRLNQERTIRENRRLAEYQYSKDLEMWNRGNEYNAPSAQMSRLRQAGLNPNLVYGGGSATTQAMQLPKYNAPTEQYNVQPLNVLGALSAYYDVRMKKAQSETMQTESDIRKLEAMLTGWKAKYWNQYGEALNLAGYNKAMFDSARSGNEADISKYRSEMQKYQRDVFKKQLDAQIDRTILQNETERQRAEALRISNLWADPKNLGAVGTQGVNILRILRQILQ